MIKEANIQISVIDSTQNNNSVNEDIVVVMAINAPTGPFEETIISNPKQFVDTYLVNSNVLSTDDPTLIHARKLCSILPIRCIRVNSNNILSGINNSGDTIYTNLNYTPFTHSRKVVLPDVDVVDQVWLGLTIVSTGAKHLFYTGSNLTLPSSAQTYLAAGSGHVVSPTHPESIDEFLALLPAKLTSATISGINIQIQNGVHLLIIDDTIVTIGVDGNNNPIIASNIYKYTTSDIGESSTSINFSDTLMSLGNYININGNCYYNRYSGVDNTIYPGIAVPLFANSTSIKASEFGIWVHDKLLTDPNAVSPQSSLVTSSIVITHATNVINTIPINGFTGFGGILLSNGNHTVNVTNVVFNSKPTYTKVIDATHYLKVYFDTSWVPGGSWMLGYYVSDVLTLQWAADATTQVNNIITTSTAWEQISGSTDLTTGSITYTGASDLILGNSGVPSVGAPLTGLLGSVYDLAGNNSVRLYNHQSIGDKVFSNTWIGLLIDTVQYYFIVGEPTDLPSLTSTVTYYYPGTKCTLPKLILFIKNIFNTYLPTYSIVTTVACKFSMNDNTIPSLQVSGASITIDTSPSLLRSSISMSSVNSQNRVNEYLVRFTTAAGSTTFVTGNYASQVSNETIVNISGSNFPSTPSPLTYLEFITELNYQMKVHGFSSISNSDGCTLVQNNNTYPTVVYKINNSIPSPTVSYVDKNYLVELQDKFAVINKFSSLTSLSSMKAVKDTSDTDVYLLTLTQKSDPIVYNISFVDDKTDGDGNNIYYDNVNSKSKIFNVIQLNPSATLPDNIGPFTFGNAIRNLAPTLGDYKTAIDTIRNDSGVDYNIIFNAGYEHVGYMSYITTLAEQVRAQSMGSCSAGDTDISAIITHRDATLIDSFRGYMLAPYTKDTTIGNFSVNVSPIIGAIERLYLNKRAGKEFAPLFGKTNGTVGILPIKSFSNITDRELLLNSQINTIGYNQNQGVRSLNDELTMQKVRSALSQFSNVYMVNVMANLLFRHLDNYIGRYNDSMTRLEITTNCTNLIRTRMYSGQLYSPADIKIVCNNTNNPISIIEANKLIVDLYVQFNGIIKYILAYQRIVNLSTDLSQVG